MFKRFQDYIRQLKPHLDEAFKRQISIFLDGIASDAAYPLMDTMEGGKKIRGGLACLISESLGGSLQSAIPRAIAMELVQTATLIHDDYVDQHRVRRNRPAIWTFAGARKAVLLGDVMFATAIKMMSELSREDGLVISHGIAQVSRGAYREPLDPTALFKEIESNRLNGELYEEIIHLKTGVLFGTACHLGAIAAKADEALRERALRYGWRVGEAYQIADDLKEVNHHLSTQSIQPEELAALSPALLHFVEQARPYVLEVLKGNPLNPNNALLEYLQAAKKLMEQEMEQRLRSAASELDEDYPKNEFSQMMGRAPWDLIKMFNES